MSRAGSIKSFVPSLLDRLKDERSGTSNEPSTDHSVTIGILKEQVKKDLQNLLNTRIKYRKKELDAINQLPELRESILLFGLPDFTPMSLSRPESQLVVKRAVEQAIHRFEPRLAHVVVSMIDPDKFDRCLRFRIDASLRVEPTPEPVSYKTDLDLSSRQFTLEPA